LTTAVEQAASVLDYRSVIVVVTDGEETCGRSPCDLATQLHEAALRLVIHVISFRYQSYSWTGEQSILQGQVPRRAKRRSIHYRRHRAGSRGEDPGLPDDISAAA
jgi:hypothetical protein